MRRSVHELTRAPDPSLGRGFDSRSGQPLPSNSWKHGSSATLSSASSARNRPPWPTSWSRWPTSTSAAAGSALGHASLFAFLVAELGLSTSSTYWRQSAARLLQRFPEIERHLCAAEALPRPPAELAKVLTEENKDAVLPRFLGISAREAQEIAAELAPRQDAATAVGVTS